MYGAAGRSGASNPLNVTLERVDEFLVFIRNTAPDDGDLLSGSGNGRYL